MCNQFHAGDLKIDVEEGRRICCQVNRYMCKELPMEVLVTLKNIPININSNLYLLKKFSKLVMYALNLIFWCAYTIYFFTLPRESNLFYHDKCILHVHQILQWFHQALQWNWLFVLSSCMHGWIVHLDVLWIVWLLWKVSFWCWIIEVSLICWIFYDDDIVSLFQLVGWPATHLL